MKKFINEIKPLRFINGAMGKYGILSGLGEEDLGVIS